MRVGFYNTIGATAAVTIGGISYMNWQSFASFVARNADALKAYVELAWHNTTLAQIIDVIVKALR
jgi:hypothetical protein